MLAQLTDGPKRKLVGLVSAENIPIRAHAPILDADGATIGEVTSGTVSPSLNQPIMLAYLPTSALATPGGRFRAQVRTATPEVT
ncbi:MAG: glycine cleavage T C-terminal barrel domain-containing protein [Burkholderiaceae bacterium]